MLVAQATQRLQEAGGGGYIATFAQDGFDDNRGRVAGRCLAVQEQIELLEAKLGRLLIIPAVVIAVGEGRHKNPAGQGLIVVAINVFGGGHGHGLMGTAVKAPLKDDDVAPPRGHARIARRQRPAI